MSFEQTLYIANHHLQLSNDLYPIKYLKWIMYIVFNIHAFTEFKLNNMHEALICQIIST